MITTMSRLERDVHCDGALVFPRSPRSSGFAARHGNLVHDFLMRVPRVGRELALEQVADDNHREALEELSLDNLPLDAASYAQEVAIAYDVETDTARELCRGQGRPDYEALGVTDYEAPGTLDVLGLTDDAVVVIDYKTGWADLGPVKDNWQLRGCALLAARLHGKQKAIIAIIRIKAGGREHFTDKAELSAMDLDDVQDALREMKGRKERWLSPAPGEVVPTSEGRWCTFCPSFTHCPSKMNLLAAGLSSELAPKRMPYFPAVLTPDTAPAAYRNLELLRGVVKRYEETLEEYAEASPVDLGGGYVYGKTTIKRESINVDRAKVLLERWLEDDAEKSVEVKRTLSQEAARKVLAKRFKGKTDPITGKRVTVEQVFQAFMESLREADALNVAITHPTMRHKRDDEEEGVQTH